MATAILPTTQLTFDKPEVSVFSGTEGAYLLPHNQDEIERLQRQHRFLKTATNDKLVAVPLPNGATVLDSGCADGTWLVDTASEFPHGLSLHGVDLSSQLFQSNPGLDLRAHDIREPFPQSWGWSNAFDLVHQRLLIWGVTSTEWSSVVHNLVELVKPGGYIQLVECEWILPHVSDQQPEQKKLNLVQSWSTESFGADIHVWNKLEKLLLAEGCEDITEESFDLGYGATAKLPEDREKSAELWAESFRHLARGIDKDGIPGVAKDAAEYHAFLDRLIIEMKTLGYTPKIKWLRGRKPQTASGVQ
ncbi:hypothetical protein MMC24_006367 [Lignoscripta atroalba]|nr:hypothetical protein [Lignoscripta atroalba]